MQGETVPVLFRPLFRYNYIVGVRIMPKKTIAIKRVMDSVQASMAVEGLKPSRKAKVISQKYLEGKLSSKEAVALITTYHAAKRQTK